MKMTYNYGRNM